MSREVPLASSFCSSLCCALLVARAFFNARVYELDPTVEQGESHWVRFAASMAGSERRVSLAHLNSLELCRRLRVISKKKRPIHEVVLVRLDGRGVRHLLLLELLIHGGVNLLVASVLRVEGEDGFCNVVEDGGAGRRGGGVIGAGNE